MTCREKAKTEHPDEFIDILDDECPHHRGYANRPDFCEPGAGTTLEQCNKCWNREATGMNKPLIYAHIPGNEIAKVEKVVEENGGVTVKATPIIKDSGDRTEFESGAVRDMREGKGRFDLVPLEVMARMFDRHDGKSGVMDFLVHFMNTNSTHFLIKALDRFALDTYGKTEKEAYATMFLEVAKHFEEGALKYGPDNWRRGIPTWCYIDSAIRHYMKWTRGDRDEAHDKAFVWNLMCCIWEMDYHKEKE